MSARTLSSMTRNPIAKLVGNRVRSLREKAGMTQVQLAEAAGIGLGMVRDCEQGNKEPRLFGVKKMADALGCKIDDFFSGDGFTSKPTTGTKERRKMKSK